MYTTNLEKKFELAHVKRRTASVQGCKLDLEGVLPLLFKAFHEAFNAYEIEIAFTAPNDRSKTHEASLLSSKMIQAVRNNFPERNCRWAKYRRFTLRINGYIFFFKKLNNKDMPMNIKTRASDAIADQMTISLFDDQTFIKEPILFFGYKKNSIGEIHDPKLVYIDEAQVRWTITEDDLTQVETKRIITSGKSATPIWRFENIRKKSN